MFVWLTLELRYSHKFLFGNLKLFAHNKIYIFSHDPRPPHLYHIHKIHTVHLITWPIPGHLIRFVPGRKPGCSILTLAGYRFAANSKHSNNVSYWLCSAFRRTGCRARVTIRNGLLTCKQLPVHNHEPPKGRDSCWIRDERIKQALSAAIFPKSPTMTHSMRIPQPLPAAPVSRSSVFIPTCGSIQYLSTSGSFQPLPTQNTPLLSSTAGSVDRVISLGYQSPQSSQFVPFPVSSAPKSQAEEQSKQQNEWQVKDCSFHPENHFPRSNSIFRYPELIWVAKLVE